MFVCVLAWLVYFQVAPFNIIAMFWPTGIRMVIGTVVVLALWRLWRPTRIG